MSFRPILNPNTGNTVFGILPPLRLGGLVVEEAGVLLFEGRHVGPNRGWGLAHIWAEHQPELRRLGYEQKSDAPLFVSAVLRERTPVYFEGGSYRSTRVLVVRSSTGTAVLEYRQRTEGAIWSVVTAFAGTKTHGTQVGTVR
jgi:hypothetical protein